MAEPRNFSLWLVQRLAYALLVGGLALTGLGLRSFLRDDVDFEVRRQELVRALTSEKETLKLALGDTTPRMAAIRVEITAQQDRARQAAKVARSLDELSSGFNRLTTSSAQLRANKERMARMQQMETNSLKRTMELDQSLVKIQWEKDGLEIALTRKQEELDATVADNSPVLHYARETWSAYGRWLLLAVAVVVFGPVFLRRRAP